MAKSRTMEQIEVMLAYEAGHKIEKYVRGWENDGMWVLAPKPKWNWADFTYRIQPPKKPKPTIEERLAKLEQTVFT